MNGATLLCSVVGATIGISGGTANGGTHTWGIAESATAMPWDTLRLWCGALCLLCGAALTLVAAVGVTTRRDPYERMHAASKPQFLGLTFLCGGVALERWTLAWAATLLIVLLIQFVTAPLGSYLLGSAFDRLHRASGVAGEDDAPLVVDELEEDLAHPSHRHSGKGLDSDKLA